MTASQKQRYQLPLSREETAGTKTFHLPFQKRSQGPEMTVMVRRTPDGSFHVGVAICSLKDCFSRREGRARAFEKLRYAEPRGFVFGSGPQIVAALQERCQDVNEHHPHTVHTDTWQDCMHLADVGEAFDKMDARQEKRSAPSMGEVFDKMDARKGEKRD